MRQDRLRVAAWSAPGWTAFALVLGSGHGGCRPANCDADFDGWGAVICDGTDCDDSESDVHPGSVELCNGRDEDCDGAIPDDERDLDRDGFAPCDGDCDDGQLAVHPGALEVCDGLDDDCDGNLGKDEADFDLDGWMACDDCDDADLDVWPGAPELCNGRDDDCDGAAEPDSTGKPVDQDGDGWTNCGGGDCDDADAAVHPGAPERCNGSDDDCDGLSELSEPDTDRDGWLVCGGDCHDGDPFVHPGSVEACNGLDDDCDPLTREDVDADGDGFTVCDGDCRDADPASVPQFGNIPPVADAGPDVALSAEATAGDAYWGSCQMCPTESGTPQSEGTWDPDGDPLAWFWSVELLDGSGTLTITGETDPDPELTLSDVTTITGSSLLHRWQVVLQVRDCAGALSQDTLEVSYTCYEDEP